VVIHVRNNVTKYMFGHSSETYPYCDLAITYQHRTECHINHANNISGMCSANQIPFIRVVNVCKLCDSIVPINVYTKCKICTL